MTSVITGAACICDKRGRMVAIAGTPSVTLPFVTDATSPRAFISCVPSSPLTFANNGTALCLGANAGLTTLGAIAAKSGGSARSAQVSSGQFASGIAYGLPFRGRYKTAA